MSSNFEAELAEFMSGANPHPRPPSEQLTTRQMMVRDAIMAEDARPPRLTHRTFVDVRKALESAKRLAAPVTAIGATAVVVAVAALTMSTAPALIAGAIAEEDVPSAVAVEEPAEAWKFARGEASSEFELDVLADGFVTLEEYREAQRLFLSCADEDGLSIAVTGSLSDGTAGYEVTSARGDQATNEIVSRCGTGTIDVIEGLYMAIIDYASVLKNAEP